MLVEKEEQTVASCLQDPIELITNSLPLSLPTTEVIADFLLSRRRITDVQVGTSIVFDLFTTQHFKKVAISIF